MTDQPALASVPRDELLAVAYAYMRSGMLVTKGIVPALNLRSGLDPDPIVASGVDGDAEPDVVAIGRLGRTATGSFA